MEQMWHLGRLGREGCRWGLKELCTDIDDCRECLLNNLRCEAVQLTIPIKCELSSGTKGKGYGTHLNALTISSNTVRPVSTSLISELLRSRLVSSKRFGQ